MGLADEIIKPEQVARSGTCRINEKNIYVGCHRPAWDGDDDDLCLLHSRKIDKDKDGAFSHAIEEQLDREDYNFSGVFFPGLLSWMGYEFKRADFSNAMLAAEVDFSLTTFNEYTSFDSAIFIGEANFSEANFAGYINFLGARFIGRAYFFRSIFTGGANFFHTNFSEYASFSVATIGSRVLFQSLNFPAKGEGPLAPLRGNFTDLKFHDQGELLFQDMSLALSEFSGTNLRVPKFHHVNWYPYRGVRKAVYDEVLLSAKELSLSKRLASPAGLLTFALEVGPNISELLTESPPLPDPPTTDDYGEIERLYRQLKINYEEERDFKRVGDFHYGEMEMHRRGSPWRQWLPSWYNFYRVLSGYGERPFRAFIWLLLLIPAWAGLVWGLGIDQAGSQNPVNYWDALLFIFEKATLQRPAWPQGITWLGKFLSSLSVLLLPGQAALFILALRNRLGRRR